MHKDCGGEIIIAAHKKEWSFVCNKCFDNWDLSSPMFPIGNLPKDFENVRDGIKLSPNNE